MSFEWSEAFLAEAAGWEAMKRARGYVAQDQVLSSDWAPPVLTGVVQAGGTSYRAGLVLRSARDLENLCTCRESREWGKLCAHSVSIGLHWLKAKSAPAPTPGPRSAPSNVATQPKAPVALVENRLRRDAISGEAAELFVILPPNFESALGQGHVTLFFEGRWPGGRSPLNALPKDRTFRFDPADVVLLDRLEAHAGGETPAMLRLSTAELGSLLPVLAGHPRVTLGKSTAVTVTNTPWAPKLKAMLEPSGEIELRLGASASLPESGTPRQLAGEDAGAPSFVGTGWVWRDRTLQPLAITPAFRSVFEKSVRIARPQVPLFLSQDWPRLLASGNVEANFRLEDFVVEPQPPRFLLQLRGGLAQLHALLQCRYGARVMTLGVTASDETVWLPDPASPTRYAARDVTAERAALSRLARCGFTGPDAQGRFQLLGENAVLNFFAREFARMQREWDVTMEERLRRSTTEKLERIEPRFQITPSGVQWFHLGVTFASTGGETFSAADIQRLVLSGQSHTRLQNGKLAVIDTGAVEELQEVLLDCAPQQHGQGYRIAHTQAGFVESTLRARSEWRVEAPAAWRERAARQAGEVALECPPLGALDAVLRPYQKSGVAWLRFLRENGFGGILADEMGLGKTLQVLALLNQMRNAECGVRNEESGAVPHPALRIPHLVVCPTSLVFNWAAETAKFTPSLKVLALHGPNRFELWPRIPESDLVITSYALIRRDAERYRDIEFDTVVLDEAQHIKNRQSQNAQSVKSIRSRHRLVLTGTPIENSVLDLWSIFDFLMPGYLGAAADFRERYEIPLTRDKNVAVQTRLARRLRPFLLRRVKRDVAPELPDKIDQTAFCELTSEQRAVYQQLIEAGRNEVLAAVGAQGFARSRLVILTTLLRLRQACCDLRLLQLDGVNPATASGKMELFGELLDEVLDGGHRALVFSQFTTMLGLLREKLAADSIDVCYLDGSTVNRAEVVNRFQSDAAVPVFLISLKAGGVGLNLTGADTVIHFDPWWNPAVEDQATGRAHRIGQSRVVTSYRLIARDTIEEKMLQLQQRKRDLFARLVEGEEAFGDALTWEDVQELLAV